MKTDRMGIFSCVALIVGACIGSAIFSISGLTIYLSGSSSILSWIIAAIIFCAYGMLVAELAARYPDSGGIYVFPRRAFGGKKGVFLGFISGWGYIISNTIAIGFSAIYVGKYLNIDGYFTSLISILLSVAVVVIGGKLSQRIQNVLVLSLLVSLLVYCFVALGFGNFQVSNLYSPFSSGAMGSTGFLVSVPLAMVAYGACLVVPFMISEIKNPIRNIPRSLYIGIGTVALIYVSVIVAILGTLPMSELENNESLRFVPLFASVSNGTLSSYRWLLYVISISGTLALITTIIALLRVNARAVQAISNDGFFFDSFSRENTGGVPAASLLVVGFLSAILSMFPSWTQQMLMLGALLNILSMSITCISLIRSRKNSVNSPGFVAPFGRVLPFAVIGVFVICYLPDVFSKGISLWIFTAIIYVIGCLFYLRGLKKTSRRYSGKVVHGKGHGRIYNIPTANINLFEGQQMPPFGVWEVKVIFEGRIYKGVTNVGLRPTDDSSKIPTIETLVIGFSGSIYDKTVTIELVRFIRETRVFSDMESLRIQIENDISSVRD